MITNFKRQLLTSLSIIFGSIIVGVVALYYLAGTVSAEANKVATDRSLINEQADSLDVLSALKNASPQAAAYKAAMDQLLPTQDGLIGFSQWISGVAAANQVVANASFQGGIAQPVGSAPGQAKFSLEVTGSLNNIAAFLQDAESKAPGFILSIDSFNLVDQNGTYQLTGQGALFFRQ
jgi:hypothetical protein